MKPSAGPEQKPKTLQEILAGIARGDIQARQIGSVGVADSADPRNVAGAVKAAADAKDLAALARQFQTQGRLTQAFTCFLQSLVLEDLIGNLYGIASDLGNLADLCLEAKNYAQAAAGFSLAIALDRRLLAELPQRQKRKGIGGAPARQERQEYHFMLGVHLNEYAVCLTEQREMERARSFAEQAMGAFREAGRSDAEAKSRKLLEWISTKLAKGRGKGDIQE
jgi:tetratricopeptide (TPR) repeat protein